MAMFEKAEDEYNNLISKKNIIEVSFIVFNWKNACSKVWKHVNHFIFLFQNDKAKIKKVIEELDEKKKETLKVTWVKVNTWVTFLAT